MLDFENWFIAEFSWEWDDELCDKVGSDNHYLYIYNEDMENVENMTTSNLASIFDIMSKGKFNIEKDWARHISEHLKKNGLWSGKYELNVRDIDRDESPDILLLKARQYKIRNGGDGIEEDFFVLKNGEVSHLPSSLLQCIY